MQTRSILVIEEDDTFRNLITQMLKRSGYSATQVSSASVPDLDPKDYWLMILDSRAANKFAFSEFYKRSSDLLTILTSERSTVGENGLVALQKPFTTYKLLQCVEDARHTHACLQLIRCA